MKKLVLCIFMIELIIITSPLKSMEEGNLPTDDTTEITLVSSDGKEIKFLWGEIKYSETVKHLIEDIGFKNPIAVPQNAPNLSADNVSFVKTLLKLITNQEELQKKLTNPRDIDYTKITLRELGLNKYDEEIEKINTKDVEFLIHILNVINYLDIQPLFQETISTIATKIQNFDIKPIYNNQTTYLQNLEYTDDVIEVSMLPVLETALVNQLIKDLPKQKAEKIFTEIVEQKKINENIIKNWKPSKVLKVKDNSKFQIINVKTNKIEKEIPLPEILIKDKIKIYISLLSPDFTKICFYGLIPSQIRHDYTSGSIQGWVINVQDPNKIQNLISEPESYAISFAEEKIKNIFCAFSPDGNFLYTTRNPEKEGQRLDSTEITITNLSNQTSTKKEVRTGSGSSVVDFSCSKSGKFFILAAQPHEKNAIFLILYNAELKEKPLAITSWVLNGHIDDTIYFNPENDTEFAIKIDNAWYKFNFLQFSAKISLPAAQQQYFQKKGTITSPAFKYLLPLAVKEKFPIIPAKKETISSEELKNSLISLTTSLQKLNNNLESKK